jgi:hypothetical protein
MSSLGTSWCVAIHPREGRREIDCCSCCRLDGLHVLARAAAQQRMRGNLDIYRMNLLTKLEIGKSDIITTQRGCIMR